nr:glycosyltransferase [Corynebacterium mycetoides]
MLQSLKSQTASSQLWEAIFVLNGPDDGAEQVLNSFVEQYPELNIRVLRSLEDGAGRARNIALACAQHQFITFVDADDWLEVGFIESALGASEDRRLTLMPLGNDVGGKVDFSNSLNLRIKANANSTRRLIEIPWALGFNACKILPSALAANLRYDESLRSGEDVVFYAQLLERPDLEVFVPPSAENEAYIRVMRADSVSRRSESFGFSVAERFRCIAALRQIKVPIEAHSAIDALVDAQFDFVVRYLDRHPDEIERAAEQAVLLGAFGLPWGKVRKNKTKKLIISYNFPPFADPAANVISKRIRTRREVVDVVHGDMSLVRKVDPSSLIVSESLVKDRKVIKSPPSFSDWRSIEDFAKQAVKVSRSDYDELYTRAMWSGSHVAGVLYKQRHPRVYWTAEFSDPMRWDSQGHDRVGDVPRTRLTRRMARTLRNSAWPDLEWQTHFDLTEAVTLLRADSLIFTNSNQLDLMLGSYPASFREMVDAKSSVIAQPSLDRSFYFAVPHELNLEPTQINIGYFGNFYQNRGLDDFLRASETLTSADRSRVVLHVFSSNAPILNQDDAPITIRTYSPLPYLQFLNACTQLDVLLVTDAVTAGTRFSKNPFLPSKLADYEGSGQPIWAMAEPGSTLSRSSVAFISDLGDVRSAAQVLQKILGLK